MNKTAVIIITVILLLGVIFQAMIIIDYHSDDINLGFFSKRETPVAYFESFDDAVAEQFFKPFDIYLRDGEKTWVLKKDEDNFNILWNEGKSILSAVLDGVIDVSGQSWSELSSNPGVLYKLGDELPMELISFILEKEEYPELPQAIEKFFIIPRDESMNVYIKSGATVYEALDVASSGLFTSNNFSGLVSLFNADPGYSNSSYTEIHNFIDERAHGSFIEPDIPVILDENPRSLPWLKLSIPDSISSFIEITKMSDSESKTAAMERTAAIIKSEIINRTINTYGTHLDSFGNLFFSNQFNIYEINKLGWISYRYTEGVEGDARGNVGPAFMNAIDTLFDLTRMSDSSSSLYLSGMREENDTYVFTFDYRIGGSVIVFSENDHAAEIKSTATRTIEATVYPVNMEEMTGENYIDSRYRTNFFDITNSNGIIIIDIEAYEMYFGYKKSDAVLEVVRPVWVLENRDGSKQILELTEAGD